MLGILANRIYRHLFAAQVIALIGTGLATVALGLGVTFGLSATFVILACIAGAALFTALLVWPASDPEVLEHQHRGLPEHDPHWAEGSDHFGHRHAHAFVIDKLHPEWPREP
ncbi:hypothetical protein [Mesorhizobium onobrychidis]|uniref:MFS transporter n=1 Tax=Mesorhizobium onobrychidis TaxID=2775404 RepID=A0ABY5R5Y0_9HYPH|nr:hypothetical protein [Mesorhizobium onobrychidis]UVC18251.1 hypothetical protein IHQ72_14890 [Mesorhizobium onobrychidis]